MSLVDEDYGLPEGIKLTHLTLEKNDATLLIFE